MTRSNNLRSTLIKTGNLTSESSNADVLEVMSDFSGASMATCQEACEGDEALVGERDKGTEKGCRSVGARAGGEDGRLGEISEKH